MLRRDPIGRWSRIALASTAVGVVTSAAGWFGGLFVAEQIGLVLVALAAGFGCVAALGAARPESRSAWTLLILGALVAALGLQLSATGGLGLSRFAYPSIEANLLLVFHLAVAVAAILALRPARDLGLALEIALDGTLFLLAASALVLALAIDAPLAQRWLSPGPAAAVVVGQIAISASILFLALLLYWRDTEFSRPVVHGLGAATLLLAWGDYPVVLGLHPTWAVGIEWQDAARVTGWGVLAITGVIATVRPGPTPPSVARTVKAQRFRRLAIPLTALLLTFWALHASMRTDVSTLSRSVVALMGLLLAIRTGVAIRAIEREGEERRRAEQLAADLQLRAISAQMSPHFLFNALHSLSALVRRDPGAAEDMLQRLGALLRYSFAPPNEWVRLDQEWKFATEYLELEVIRLGPRLRVSETLPDDATGVLVPPFVVQPLAENAVRHGVNPFPKGGTVELRAELVDGRIRIDVTDSGPGTSKEAISTSPGVGLQGVRAQLESYFGSHRWSLTAGPAPGGGFRVRVEFPVE